MSLTLGWKRQRDGPREGRIVRGASGGLAGAGGGAGVGEVRRRAGLVQRRVGTRGTQVKSDGTGVRDETRREEIIRNGWSLRFWRVLALVEMVRSH